MKRMIYADTMTLVCLSTIPVVLATVTSLNLKASAAEGACELSLNPAVTGEEVQKKIDDIARCNNRDQAQHMVEISHEVKDSSPQKMDVMVVNSQRTTNDYPSYCGVLPSGLAPTDPLYNAFLYRCKYGD
jgi:hypothetical protein